VNFILNVPHKQEAAEVLAEEAETQWWVFFIHYAFWLRHCAFHFRL
jgi:hypothetical protein